ncbi:MAG TPA: DNA polymerase Y family protein [Candidatus Acidoferrum sp.]|nr:DNA polymerase Y family protein [Candidatus Acidoferrum sp.]
MPFASLFIPDFPVQAVVRMEPELRNKAVGVFAGAAPLTKVFAANAAARRLGIETGMTRMQAEAFAGIEWRWRSPASEATAHAALLDCAWTISPRVQNAGKRSENDLNDTVVLDLAGCEKLFGSPEKIAQDLRRAAVNVGFEANVAVAENDSAAVTAAQGFSGVTVIPPGEENARIGALALENLRMPLDSLETLRRWGIHTCLQFGALPEIAVVERLGQEGRHWQQIAQGKDTRPLIALDFPDQFEECMELESPVELLEPLLFLLNRLLEQLCARLRMHILAISEVRVALTLEQNSSLNKEPLQHIRTIRLPVPAKEGKFLLKLLRLDLEAHPPRLPVTGINFVVIPAKTRSRQLGLFLPLSPDLERLEVTLARIQSTVGEGRIGAPELLDTNRPNAFQQKRFAQPEVFWNGGKQDETPRAALRIYRPPLAANVEMSQGKPVRLMCDGVSRPILAFAGPWKTNGDWWSETVWARHEWDVKVQVLRPKRTVETGQFEENEIALYRIYKDQVANCWFVEGIYD